MGKLPTEFERMIQRLENLVRVGEAGKLAGLRRGVNKPPGLVPEAYAQVAPFLEPGTPAWKEEAAYHLATLFAWWHQGRDRLASRPPRNMGASFRLLAERPGGSAEDQGRSESVERRFTAVLKARLEALPHHLRHAVGLLNAHDVAVDWRNLLQDLWDWRHPDLPVQRRWSRSFWAPERSDPKLPT